MSGLRAEIERFASSHTLDPDLVHALVRVESAENRFAFNPEPRYKWFWDCHGKKPFRDARAFEVTAKFPPKDFYDMVGNSGDGADHEWWGQQASWGLMQIMGAVAREMGFKEIYLTQLVEVPYNLEYGCSYLKRMLKLTGGDMESALASYNGGPAGNEPDVHPKRNQAYVEKVLTALAEVRGRRTTSPLQGFNDRSRT